MHKTMTGCCPACSWTFAQFAKLAYGIYFKCWELDTQDQTSESALCPLCCLGSLAQLSKATGKFGASFFSLFSPCLVTQSKIQLHTLKYPKIVKILFQVVWHMSVVTSIGNLIVARNIKMVCETNKNAAVSNLMQNVICRDQVSQIALHLQKDYIPCPRP